MMSRNVIVSRPYWFSSPQVLLFTYLRQQLFSTFTNTSRVHRGGYGRVHHCLVWINALENNQDSRAVKAKL